MRKYNNKYRYDNSYRGHEKEESYIRAKKKLEKITGFYWHLASYIIINLFLTIVIVVNSSLTFWDFGTHATAFFWGIGLLFHFIGVFGQNALFNRDWEERKIKEYMDKDQKRGQGWE